MVMNKEPNIFVIDPFVGITGRTNLCASIPLGEPGGEMVLRASNIATEIAGQPGNDTNEHAVFIG